MKLLVIGHPFLLAYNQRKYVELKSVCPELDLCLLVPSFGRDRFDPKPFQIHPDLKSHEVKALKSWWSKSHMTYIHSPIAIASILRSFRPEVIHIEEEPQAFITVETIALRRLLAPRARVSVFTWDNLLRPRRFPIGLLKRTLRSYSLHRIHKVVCGNKRAAELVVEEGKFAGELPVLPQYGIDPNEYQPGTEPTLRAELGLSADIVIGYVGRLVPEKGIRLIFEALANLQWLPWKLLLIGAGPLEQEIRECWMPQFPGRVVLHPAVDYEAVARFMRCMDIFVLPSYATHCWAEQFGLTLAQAMMLGIPSVASRSGAIPDVLGPGGLLFREKNTQELAVALEALLNSAERRKEIGASGRAFALQNYTTAAVAKRYAAALFNAEERPEQAAAVSAIADM